MLPHLPFGLMIEDLIVGLAALAAILTVAAIWAAFLPRDPVSARARALVERRQALKAAATAPRRRAQAAKAMTMMRTVVNRLNLARSRQAEQRSMALARAGFRSNDAIIAYLFARVAAPIICGALGVLCIYVLNVYKGPPTMRFVVLIGVILFGGYLPDLYLKNLSQKRQQQLTRALPDALDLMVICTEAGLSLDSSLQRVAKELGRSWPELADEFSLTSVEIGFLPDRRQALENLSDRTGLPGIRAMVHALAQTEKFGTPLAESMRVLAAELRHERLMKAEEKAARLPVILTVPMMVFILPPLFIVLLGPAILRLIDGLGSV